MRLKLAELLANKTGVHFHNSIASSEALAQVCCYLVSFPLLYHVRIIWPDMGIRLPLFL